MNVRPSPSASDDDRPRRVMLPNLHVETAPSRPTLLVPSRGSADPTRVCCSARGRDAATREHCSRAHPPRWCTGDHRAADGRMTSRLPLQAIVSIVTLEIEKHAVCPLVDLAHGPAEAAEVLREEGSCTLPRRRLSAHEAPQYKSQVLLLYTYVNVI